MNSLIFQCINSSVNANGIAKSVEPNQTAPREQFDLGLHCLLRAICPDKGNLKTGKAKILIALCRYAN